MNALAEPKVVMCVDCGKKPAKWERGPFAGRCEDCAAPIRERENLWHHLYDNDKFDLERHEIDFDFKSEFDRLTDIDDEEAA